MIPSLLTQTRALLNKLILVVVMLAPLNYSLIAQTTREPLDGIKISKNAKKGDKYFADEEYFVAADAYETALKKDGSDAYAAYMLGKSRMAYFNYKGAIEAFDLVKSFPNYQQYFELTDYWYGSMQKIEGNYKEAKQAYTKFIGSFQEDPNNNEHQGKLTLARLELEGCELALEEMKKPVREYDFKLLPPPVNSGGADLAPVVYQNDSSIIITSSRRKHADTEGDFRYTKIFTDNLRFEKNDVGSWMEVNAEDGFKKLNTNLNDGAGVFSSDLKKFYYTSCGKEDVCEIFLSQMKAGEWQEPIRLNENINMPGYYSRQPALSPSGDTLYFVSDRPGGMGMSDIWYSTRKGDQEDWSEAVNMKEVNTALIDMSPCVYAEENTFFFASNGRKGFGGIDIYLCKFDNLSEVKNAGFPFNSHRDDFYFTIGEKRGYLSSNRDGGVGNDDIYSFLPYATASTLADVSPDTLDKYKSVSLIGSIFSEKQGGPAYNMQVVLRDKNNVPIKETTTNPEGKFRFDNLPTNQSYRVGLDEEMAFSRLKNDAYEFEFIYDKNGNQVLDQDGKPAKRVRLPPSYAVVNGVMMEDFIINAEGTKVRPIPNDGQDKYFVEEFDAESRTWKRKPVPKDVYNQYIGEYEIKWEEESMDLFPDYDPSEDDFEEAFTTENYERKVPDAVRQDEVYLEDFNVNAGTNRPRYGSDGVDVLANNNIRRKTNSKAGSYEEFMQNLEVMSSSGKKPSVANPSDLKLETFEVKGSQKPPSKILFENIYFDFDTYSLREEAKLTLDKIASYLNTNSDVQVEIRANADAIGPESYNQLLSKLRGEAAKKYLVSKGTDLTKIVVTAQGESEAFASNKNAIGRQLNRRVEFYIVGGENFEAHYKVYVVMPGNTLASLARRFNMEKETLAQINGLNPSSSLLEWTPLRVKRADKDGVVDAYTLKMAEELPKDAVPEARYAKLQPLDSPDQQYYTVQKDETLFRISQKFDMSVDEIKQLNDLKDNRVLEGQKLIVKTEIAEAVPGQ